LQGKKADLQKMYEEWPFFGATIDLIEMILAKADMRIAALYDDVLVDDPAGKKLGSELRQKFVDTVRAVCEVGGGPVICEEADGLLHQTTSLLHRGDEDDKEHQERIPWNRPE
jgi:phosphoenolpyruvate carboxylase